MRQFTMKIDDDLLLAVKKRALASGRNVSDIVRDLLAREVGWSDIQGPAPLDANEVKRILLRYSDRSTTRRETMYRVGLDPSRYPEFVKLMHSYGVRWPEIDRAQIDKEAELVVEAVAVRTHLILTDSGPLFSFAAVPGGLDLLLAAELPVVLTDYIEWEATRSGSATAKLIAAWIKQHPEDVKVIETERGQDRIEKERRGETPKRARRNVGEQTIFEALSEGDLGDGPFLFMFEDNKFVDPGFHGTHPVHSVTTLGFLVGLERSRVIENADEIFRAMRSTGREGVKAIKNALPT